jgi:uncharacterized damage-inducible protein DinB
MSIAKEAFLMDLDYSAWADQVLLEACSALTADELARDLGASHRSVLDTLRHIYYTERVWVRRLHENAMPPMREVGDQKLFCDPPPEPELAELKRDWPEVWKAGHEWLENLPEAELEGTLSSRMPDGTEFRMSRWKIVMHSVNHSTLHRRQVVGMLRALGRQPPNTDLFSYYLQQV